MTDLVWIWRSLRHHWRAHTALACGAALAAAILAAALLTGEALRLSLARLAGERLGAIRAAIELRGATAPAALAERLQAAGGGAVAPLLSLSGSLRLPVAGDDPILLPRVQAIGIDARFLALAGAAAPHRAPTNNLALWSAALADELTALAFDPAPRLGGGEAPWNLPLLQTESLSPVAAELPLGAPSGSRQRRGAPRPAGLLPDAALGRFGLEATQIAPRNLFVARDWLATLAEAPGRANLFVSDASPERLRAALRQALAPADSGVSVTRLAGGWKVASERLFLARAQVEALTNRLPRSVPAGYHLADSFEAAQPGNTNATPYGFVAALGAAADPSLGVVTAALRDDEALISSWLAQTLGLAQGERLRLRWRRPDAEGRLRADSAVFTVAGVLPQESLVAERAWMPEFPGLSEVESCADWDIGLPMDAAALNDPANEAYWDNYGATPKVYLTYAAGRRLFGSPFGDTMAVRVAAAASAAEIDGALRGAAPEALGFAVRPVADEAGRAVAQALDFRQLFVGMSLFLMAAALALTALMAALAAGARAGEAGLLKACGMATGRIRRLMLAEQAAPLALGSLAGAALGGLLGRALVWALNRGWGTAVGGTRIWPDFRPGTALLAALLAMLAVLAAVSWSSRRRLRTEAMALLLGASRAGAAESVSAPRARAPVWTLGIGVTGAAALLLLASFGGAGEAGGIFFGAGALLLPAIAAALQMALSDWSRRGRPAGGGLARAGVLNLTRHPWRAHLTALPLAAGIFLSIGILAMRHDPAAHLERLESGGGGFQWLAEAPAALPYAEGAQQLARFWPGARVVGLRVRDGDAAECLNLNRAQVPRLLGVPLEEMIATGAFTGPEGADIWRQLESPLPDGCVPGLAGDRTTLQYGLAAKAGKGDGAILTYPAAEGGVLRVRLVGTLPQRVNILQGSILVDARHFTRALPGLSGYRLWLVAAGVGGPAAAAPAPRLRRQGWEAQESAARLRALGAMENSYLDMFLVLGGLGVVLGAAGLALVLLRNVSERRGELALLRAIGVSRGGLRRYLLAEHLWLLLAGALAGVLPALLAIQPALRNLAQPLPLGSLAAVIAGLLLSGAAWTLAAALWALRGERLWAALRGE